MQTCNEDQYVFCANQFQTTFDLVYMTSTIEKPTVFSEYWIFAILNMQIEVWLEMRQS